ncbi:GRAM domain-containing protein [Algoriphagus yeomjeoni]|uniref:GRAM domain-containing protein n=1 Tax=Algoriphagus yeomjeoni TaxID=291403 RepID=UPI003CE50A3E
MVTELNQMTWGKRLVIFAINAGIFMLGLYLIHYFMDGKAMPLSSLIFQSVFLGLFMTIGFPYIFKKLGNSLGKSIHPELSPSEEVEMEGPANLFRGAEAVGGKLFLTDQNLIFKSHSFNIQTGQSAIPFESIAEVSARKTAKLVDNGLRILTHEGITHDFVVVDRAHWIVKLEEKLKVD